MMKLRLIIWFSLLGILLAHALPVAADANCKTLRITFYGSQKSVIKNKTVHHGSITLENTSPDWFGDITTIIIKQSWTYGPEITLELEEFRSEGDKTISAGTAKLKIKKTFWYLWKNDPVLTVTPLESTLEPPYQVKWEETQPDGKDYNNGGGMVKIWITTVY